MVVDKLCMVDLLGGVDVHVFPGPEQVQHVLLPGQPSQDSGLDAGVIGDVHEAALARDHAAADECTDGHGHLAKDQLEILGRDV